MLHRDGVVRPTPATWSPPDGQPHFAAEGQERHLAVHERRRQPPGELRPQAGARRSTPARSIAETPFKDAQNPEKLKLARVVVVNDANGQQRNKLYPLQVGFKKHGQSGIEVSDWLPHVGECVDDLAVVRSMWTTDNNHGAQTQFHTGRHMLDGEFPTLGAWVHYGLGSLNDNLPQFVSHGQPRVLEPEGRPLPRPGARRRAAARRPGQPARLRHARRPGHAPTEQQIGFDLLGKLNRLRARRVPRRPGPRRPHQVLRAGLPHADVGARGARLRERDRGDARSSTASTSRRRRPFGMQLLAARRLVERGVRFVQVQHGAGGAGRLGRPRRPRRPTTRSNCLAVDQADRRPAEGPEAARPARTRRSSSSPPSSAARPARRAPTAATTTSTASRVWLAGGGIKGGIVHGATDELGFHAVEDRHYVTDIHATVLHQLGLDSRQLEVPGRKRLEIDHGKPIKDHRLMARRGAVRPNRHANKEIRSLSQLCR